MTLDKIPTFNEVKNWAASKTSLDNHKNNSNNPHSLSVSAQDPTDISSSRSASTTYTNNTGNPIFVGIIASEGGRFGNNGSIIGYVNGNKAQEMNWGGEYNGRGCISFLVPNGSTYKVTSKGGITNWSEQEITL